MSTTLWHYRTLGGEFGPVTSQALFDLVRSGQLGGSDEVRPASRAVWQSAAEFLTSHAHLAAGEPSVEFPTSADLDDMLAAGFEQGQRSESTAATSSSAADVSRPLQQSASNTPKWYCRIAGLQCGPFDLPELTRLVDSGKLASTDRVRLEDEAMWVTADGIVGLFDRTPVDAAIGATVPTRTAQQTSRLNGMSDADRSQARVKQERRKAEPSTLETALVDQADTDFELNLKQTKRKPSRKPKPGEKRKATGEKIKDAKAKVSGKSDVRRSKKVELSNDDIADILTTPSVEEEDGEADAPRSRRIAAAPASPPSGFQNRPAPASPVVPPPLPQPSRVPPPQFSRPAKRSSSSDPSWISEFLSERKNLKALGVLVALPVLWFAWPYFAGAGLPKKGDKYYYALVEDVYYKYKRTSAADFKHLAEVVLPMIEQLESGTSHGRTECATKLHECATDHFPKLIEGDFKQVKANLEPIRQVLESVKPEF